MIALHVYPSLSCISNVFLICLTGLLHLVCLRDIFREIKHSRVKAFLALLSDLIVLPPRDHYILNLLFIFATQVFIL